MDPGTEGDPNDPGAVNVIKYDDKTLKIHNVGHFAFNRETGEKEQLPEGALETLDGALDRMQQALSGHDFSIARQAIIQLQKLEDQDPVQQAFRKINTALSAEGLSDSATVEDYLSERLMKGLDTNVPESLKKEIVKYLLDTPDNIGKRQIKKGLSKEEQTNIDEIVRSKRMILREAILPIEMAVHDYTVEILKGLKSVFIANTGKEVDRLKQELAKAVKEQNLWDDDYMVVDKPIKLVPFDSVFPNTGTPPKTRAGKIKLARRVFKHLCKEKLSNTSKD